MGKLIVTIARQYGSGGKTIGQMLAENLGVNCYNREILRMASDDSGIKEELFNQADEKLRNNPLFGNSTRIRSEERRVGKECRSRWKFHKNLQRRADPAGSWRICLRRQSL